MSYFRKINTLNVNKTNSYLIIWCSCRGRKWLRYCLCGSAEARSRKERVDTIEAHYLALKMVTVGPVLGMAVEYTSEFQYMTGKLCCFFPKFKRGMFGNVIVGDATHTQLTHLKCLCYFMQGTNIFYRNFQNYYFANSAFFRFSLHFSNFLC